MCCKLLWHIEDQSYDNSHFRVYRPRLIHSIDLPFPKRGLPSSIVLRDRKNNEGAAISFPSASFLFPILWLYSRSLTYYILLKDDLEVVVAKGNLILPRQNPTTGCSLKSCPGHMIIIIITIIITIIIIIIIFIIIVINVTN